MFDIGSPELLLLAIVALLAFGPERLPEAIRGFAAWYGRARRSMGRLASQVEKEVRFHEIRQQLHEEQVMGEIRSVGIALTRVTEDVGLSPGEVVQSEQGSADPSHWPGMPPPETGTQ